MSQTKLVLRHLFNHGYITQMVANNYGVRRLAARVHELRMLGWPVVGETRTDDLGVRYAYYTMNNPAWAKAAAATHAAA